MNTAHSTDRPSHEYQPTIIECRPLISRLAVQLAFLKDELKRSWPEFKKNPLACTKTKMRELLQVLRSSPNAIPATLAALVALACAVVMLLMIDKSTRVTDRVRLEEDAEIVFMDVKNPAEPMNNSIGLDGPGRVGFSKGTGEGSSPSKNLAQGGGGGGNRTPLPPQSGKLPPPSNIQAAIPIAPPIHTPELPVAGMDIDPALWKDLKAPVFGDPVSASTAESKGSGKGEGIGTGEGLGIGAGSGPGYGPGKDGNIGDGPRQLGCCGSGGGNSGDGNGNAWRPAEVEQRARLLLKPEPQYTDEARRNLVTGTVVLRAVFSSSGEVVQIRAVRTLPFGLTERAIAAARQIQFVPALKGGQPVSVSMQLEYNFNLY
jgi:TonB family protein